ncbi:MAG: ParA family protein [Lachnospirales bacterium]
MRIISIANLKGGVGKSTTTINLGYNLSKQGYKVLLVDNDKQGNTSEFFCCSQDDDEKGTHTILLEKKINMKELIVNTKYENLDIIPTNMKLLEADMRLLLDTSRPREKIYEKAFAQVASDYDYCIIDNTPSLDFSVVNALVCANEVIITVKIDNFCKTGLNILAEQIDNLKDSDGFNIKLNKATVLFTMCNNSNVSKDGNEYIKSTLSNLSNLIEYKSFETKISRTVVVYESTFAKKPLSIYNNKSTASIDYEKLAEEFLSKRSI